MDESDGRTVKMRTLQAYVILVGLPIFGIFGVLHFGKGIRSPISVAGDWYADLRPGSEGQAYCGEKAIGRAFTINVSQSGSVWTIGFNEGHFARLNATLADTRVFAADADASLQIKAEINKPSEPDRMFGSIIIASCDDKDGVAFVATRQTGPKRIAGTQ